MVHIEIDDGNAGQPVPVQRMFRGDGDIAEETIEEFRRRDAELLRYQTEFGAQQGYEKMREDFDLKDS